MAINYPSEAFSGGAVKFPYGGEVNIYAQLMARKKAQGDAIDDYYRKHADTLNPEGVRYKDLPYFQKAVEDYKTHAINNKEKLRKGDIPTQIESEQLYRNAQGIIVGSKDAAMGEKEGLAVGEKLRTEDKNAEPMFQELQFNQLPINDPNYKRFNSGQYFQTSKNYDEAGYLSKFKDIKRDEVTTLGKVDPKTGYRIDTYTKTIPEDKKQQIAAQAMMDYYDKWSFNDRVRDVVKNPEEKQKLSEYYQQQFGKVPTTNEELAAAYVLRGVNPVITEQGKPVRDEKWTLDYKAALDRQQKQWENDLSQMNKVQKNIWLKEFMEDQANKARTDEFGNQKPMRFYETGIGRIAGNEIPLSSFLNKSFTKGKAEPSKIIVSDVNVTQPDGSVKLERKYTPLYYAVDDKGEKNLIKELSIPQDINMTVVDMGGQVGKSQQNREGSALVGKQSETKKTTTVSSTKSTVQSLPPKGKYIDIKVVNGEKWGKTKDGQIEKIN